VTIILNNQHRHEARLALRLVVNVLRDTLLAVGHCLLGGTLDRVRLALENTFLLQQTATHQHREDRRDAQRRQGPFQFDHDDYAILYPVGLHYRPSGYWETEKPKPILEISEQGVDALTPLLWLIALHHVQGVPEIHTRIIYQQRLLNTDYQYYLKTQEHPFKALHKIRAVQSYIKIIQKKLSANHNPYTCNK